jgi:broad specificity phosphatase PhoE
MQGKAGTIYLLRHPESTFNRLGLVQGHSFGAVPTEAGLVQAQSMLRYLESRAPLFEKIFSSDLPRASVPAEVLLPRSKAVSVEKTPLLREVGWGCLEGKPYSCGEWRLVEEGFMQGIDALPNGSGAEGMFLAQQRVHSFLMQLAKSEPLPLLVMGHGETNKLLISMLLGDSISSYLLARRQTLSQPNCCINEIIYDGRQLSVKYFGYVPCNIPLADG